MQEIQFYIIVIILLETLGLMYYSVDDRKFLFPFFMGGITTAIIIFLIIHVW